MALLKKSSDKTGEPVKKTGKKGAPEPRVITECFCHNKHSLIDDLSKFGDYKGISLKLVSSLSKGQLTLSPVIGDLSRTFFNFNYVADELIKICCPTCLEPLPVYDTCSCGADLVAIFTSRKADFSECVGICQRVGCLNAKIMCSESLSRLIRHRHYFY
ncbi:MAG: hypothetical protein P1P74_10615 [Desulfuromonadales bacterium]|nr:hypothetical protein [Desulfuromonadales bacterium]